MKTKFTFLTLICIILSTSSSLAAEKGCSANYSSLVLDEGTGDILYGKRSDEQFYPASLVKIMTLYLTFEALDKNQLTMDKELTISDLGEEISRVNKVNSLHLKVGNKITVRDAIYSVIVKSFNEAAVTLAEAVGGNEWNFVRLMNEKAAELGMIHTSFRNASGLHAEGQYTTSYDLARLAIAIKHDFPGYYHLFALKEFKYRDTKYETHNHVLVDYKGAEGMKTGFTKASGFNLITSAKRQDRRIISVLLGCATQQRRDKLTKELLNESFKNLEKSKIHPQLEEKLSKTFDYNLKEESGANRGEICEPLVK
jgi:D-alanyl-D-alanine carboxypeptidase